MPAPQWLLKKNKAFAHGFTLIEIMLIMILLTLVTAIIVSLYSSLPESPAVIKARETILSLDNALKLYKLDNGFYPTTRQGLKALVIKPKTEPIPQHWIPYLPCLPVDQWGNPFHYINPGNDEIRVYSSPPPGKLTLADKLYYWYYYSSYHVVTYPPPEALPPDTRE